MKKTNSILTLLVGTSLFASLPVLAQDATPKNHPCKKIRTACEAAGFSKGGHKQGNKGEIKDCLKPILAGQTVPGVTVDPSDIQACQARKEKHHDKDKKS